MVLFSHQRTILVYEFIDRGFLLLTYSHSQELCHVWEILSCNSDKKFKGYFCSQNLIRPK